MIMQNNLIRSRIVKKTWSHQQRKQRNCIYLVMEEHLEKQPLKKDLKWKWRSTMNLKNKIMIIVTIMKIVLPIWTIFQVSLASLDQRLPRLRTKRITSSIEDKLSESLAIRQLREAKFLLSKIKDSREIVFLKTESLTLQPRLEVIWQVSEMKDFPRLLLRMSKRSKFKSVRELWEKMATRSIR